MVPETYLRRGKSSDLARLLEIYNHYVVHTAITFDLEPQTLDQRRSWFQNYRDQGPYQLFVAEVGGRVVGYAHSSQFRTKAAYDTSVETTVYLDPAHGRQGLGRALYGRLFRELAATEVHRAYAGITLPNEASLGLHRAFDFLPCGIWTEVGFKFGRYWDVSFWEKAIVPVSHAAL